MMHPDTHMCVRTCVGISKMIGVLSLGLYTGANVGFSIVDVLKRNPNFVDAITPMKTEAIEANDLDTQGDQDTKASQSKSTKRQSTSTTNHQVKDVKAKASDTLSVIASCSCLLAYLWSPRKYRHPYLIYVSMFSALSCLSSIQARQFLLNQPSQSNESQSTRSNQQTSSILSLAGFACLAIGICFE